MSLEMISRVSALSRPWFKIKTNLSRKLQQMISFKLTSTRKNWRRLRLKKKLKKKRKLRKRQLKRPRRLKKQLRRNKNKTRKKISCRVPKPNCRQLQTNLPIRLNNQQQQFKRKLLLLYQLHNLLNPLYHKVPIRKQSIVLLKNHKFQSHRQHILSHR